MRGLEKVSVVDQFCPISIIIDDDQEHAFDYYKHLNNLKTHPDEQFKMVKDRISSISFCRDDIYPGIQAADMIAWVARRYKVEGTEIDFDTMPLSLYPNLTHGGRHQVKMYTEELLYEVARNTSAAKKRGEQ
jgi:hypothetical protein